MAIAPDRLATMIVIGVKTAKGPEDALYYLDIGEVMGNQIKSIKHDGKVIRKQINGLSARIFSGTANVANVKTPFVAAVIRKDRGPWLVVFASPSNNAHMQRMAASIDTVRVAPKEGK